MFLIADVIRSAVLPATEEPAAPADFGLALGEPVVGELALVAGLLVEPAVGEVLACVV